MQTISRKQRRNEKKIKKLKLEILLVTTIAVLLTVAIIFILKISFQSSLS